MLGVSSYAWRVKHNVAHHTYTNVDGYDDDIACRRSRASLPSQPAQAVVPPAARVRVAALHADAGLRWQIGDDVCGAPAAGASATARSARADARWDLAGAARAARLIFIGWAIVVPLLVYPWWSRRVGYVGVAMRGEPRDRGHVPARPLRRGGRVRVAGRAGGDEARLGGARGRDRPSTSAPATSSSPGSLGGLNFQIEHHLFPRVPHTHYPRIAEIVRRKAAEHGVRYTAQPSLRVAIRSHQRHLRALGRVGRPFEIEMG